MYARVLINADVPNSGCVASRFIGPGIVLREAAYIAEVIAGKSACEQHARLCIMCMVWETHTHIHSNRRLFIKHPNATLQSWTINVEEWNPNCIIFPENVNGSPNGLVAPFLAWDATHRWFIDTHHVNNK